MSFRYAGGFNGASSDSEDVPLASTSRLPDLPQVKQQPKSKKNSTPIVIEDDEDDEDAEAQFAAQFEEEDVEEEIEEVGELLGEEEASLSKLNSEISQVESQIAQLQSLRSTLNRERSSLAASINFRKSKQKQQQQQFPSSTSKPKPSKGAINFVDGTFSWDTKVKELAKKVWGIDSFRLCQKAVINASLEGFDVVAVMPTGAGKSLTYQLPALVQKGTSVVITPLISLMQDQVWNLKEHGVKAEMLNSATDQATAKDIHARMIAGLKEGKDRDIKLVYVTPERIEKSKTFVSVLQKLYDNNSLSRIIIDEAHCISTIGNDFRPSYKSLGRLRTLFPNTPVIAVTATAPPSVVRDMLKSLQMSEKTSIGESALPNTSVLFTSPLYRKNLHYSVISKPTAAAAVIDIIVDYVKENHSKKCGIIYCLSRTDTENVAKGIIQSSKGTIRVGVYHAGIDDAEKVRIHDRWRKGEIQIIAATNSFGLGIDAPDVRFVIHHSIAKSIDSYYQESGRAGRDGLDSDCVVLYRSADATRLSTLTYADFANSGKKLYDMISYGEDLKTCRKIAFARYFTSTHENKNAFEEGSEVDETCGHCDNCIRDPDSFSEVDITSQVYKALRILAGTRKNGVIPTLTLTQACDLVRGNGGGKFSTQETKGKGESRVDIEEEAGGKVTLTKEQTESMLILLLIKGYLKEQFHATAYNTISYLNSTSLAARFTRFSPEEFSQLDDPPHKITMNILDGKKKKRKASTSDSKTSKKQKVEDSKVKKETKPKKGKSKMIVEESEEEEDGEEDIEAMVREAGEYEEEEDEVEVDDDGWQVFKANDSDANRSNLKPEKGNSNTKKGGGGKIVEVLDLVDDSD